jgi:Concanavalin A-like lectin/glucanases superfamily
MSYKSVVLNDHPTSFYLLDEVISGTTISYDALKTQYATYAALRDGVSSYANLGGALIYDYSGNSNNGVSFNSSNAVLMPLVPGSISGTKMNSDTKIIYNTPGMATSTYKNNPFSIDLWFKPPQTSTNEIPLAFDTTNLIGVTYKNGNVLFKIGSSVAVAKIEKTSASYISAVYNGSSITLYVNGIAKSTKSIAETYPFVSQAVSFMSGPSNESNLFVIDCVAFYRYALSETQIQNHYMSGSYELNHMQIVEPDGGVLFTLNHSKILPAKQYYYPSSIKWSDVINTDAVLSVDHDYITFAKTDTQESASFSFIQEILIPSGIGINSSQLNYYPDIENISVSISLDGLTNWRACENNKSLPYLTKDDLTTNQLLYIKVTMSSADTSFDIPKLETLAIDLFKNMDYYADNSGDRIYSDKDYDLSRYNERILSYNNNNGLSMHSSGGFNIESSVTSRTLEMIYTPGSGTNVLFANGSKIFQWSTDGTITKSGISNIYVNGQNVTSQTNCFNYFTVGLPHHVVIVLSTSTSGLIKINQNVAGTSYGLGSKYNNIAIYQNELTEAQILRHYNYYIGNWSNAIGQEVLSIQESASGNDLTAYSVYSIELAGSNITI